MRISMGFLKPFLSILKYIFAIIAVVVMTLGLAVIVQIIQVTTLIPEDYIIWCTKYSGNMIMFVFEVLFIIMFFYFSNRKKPDFNTSLFGIVLGFIKRNMAKIIWITSLVLVVAVYYMVISVSIISKDKIVNRSFFNPKGKEYSYSDIKSINTGVYGKNIFLVRSKGEYYYNIELKDGTRINLNSVGGTENDRDSYETIMELDEVLVDRGITKHVDSKYFELAAKQLDKIYADRIKRVLENVK